MIAAKAGLFRISTELQFWIYNNGEHMHVPKGKRKRKILSRKRKLRRLE